MIKAIDVLSGYGQNTHKKPNTSILPYLRAQQKRTEETIRAELKKEYEDLKGSEPQKEDKEDLESMKNSLRSIHPTATEADLEAMAKDAGYTE